MSLGSPAEGVHYSTPSYSRSTTFILSQSSTASVFVESLTCKFSTGSYILPNNIPSSHTGGGYFAEDPVDWNFWLVPEVLNNQVLTWAPLELLQNMHSLM